MKKFIEEDEEINRLTEEIGQYGEPYASDEPDPVYWANFRVRVMDEIEHRETKLAGGWLSSLGQALFGSPLKWASAAAGLAAVVIAIVMLGPSAPEPPQIADKIADKVAVGPAPTFSPANTPQLGPATGSTKVELPGTATPSHSAVEHRIEKQAADATAAEVEVTAVDGAKAVLAALAPEDADSMTQSTRLDASDAPVSLADLSVTELESVLSGLEND